MKHTNLLFLLIAHPRIRLLPSNGTADGGRCRTADGQHRLTKQIDGRTLSDDFYIRSGIKFPTEIYR